MGISRPKCSAAAAPKSPADARTSGKIERGTPNNFSNSLLHSRLSISKSSVRDAFV
jgi:hypothetical protein